MPNRQSPQHQVVSTTSMEHSNRTRTMAETNTLSSLRVVTHMLSSNSTVNKSSMPWEVLETDNREVEISGLN
jgi:hypothetical protein